MARHAGDALVPLADLFNHKASVVELADGYVVGEEADDKSSESEEEETATSSGSRQAASHMVSRRGDPESRARARAPSSRP